MNSKVNKTDVLRRIRTYPSTPKGFDPNKASPEEILKYGFPRRPDPEKEPELARIWKEVFTPSVRFVEAKLGKPVMRSSLPTHGTERTAFRATGWAGPVKFHSKNSDFTEPATMVFSKLKLPKVEAITIDNDTLKIGFWVGLDGAPGVGLPDAAQNQVLQAGVEAHVVPPLNWMQALLTPVKVYWWAWYEWDTAQSNTPAVPIYNLPVAAEDEIFVFVAVEHGVRDKDRNCADTDLGFVSMLNITRGIGTSVSFFVPDDTVSQGLSAEWIVEVPEDSPHMPIFSPVTFSECTAGSLVHGVFNLTGEISERITTEGNFPAGTPLTKTTINSPTVAVVEELEVDWFVPDN